MKIANLFNNGRSQAVRLPKEFRFEGNDIYIKKFDNIVMLIPKDDQWASLIGSLNEFSNDFMETRNQTETESLEKL